MITIAGYWDFSWSTPSEEMFYWEGVVREFDAKLIMSPVTGIRNRYVQEVHDLDEIIDNWVRDVVYVSESGSTEISDFQHPEKALYVFGRSNYNPFNARADKGGTSIKIATSANTAMMLAPVAASIVMYDRFRKWHLQ